MALATVAATALGAAAWSTHAMGTDLSAQIARAHFAAIAPGAVVDLRWFGGVDAYGYSLIAPWFFAHAGIRVGGALVAILAARSLVMAARAVRARREPAVAAAAIALVLGSLVDGRLTFLLGVWLGAIAVRTAIVARSEWRGSGVAACFAALAAAASPVAALALALVASALVLTRRRRAFALAGAAGGVVVIQALAFGDGGAQPFSGSDVAVCVAVALAIGLLIAERGIRLAAALAALVTVAAALAATPLGSNDGRIVALLAPLVLLGASTSGRRALVALVLGAVVVGWALLPAVSDVRAATTWSALAARYAPLRAELVRLPAGERVEVVPDRGHWEVAYLPEVYLARGWERQVDVARDPLFYSSPLTDAAYVAWLRAHAVGYVVLGRWSVDVAGTAERALLTRGVVGLSEIWAQGGWQVWQVSSPAPLAEGATVVTAAPAALTLRPVAPGVRVTGSGSRWLTATAPCQRSGGSLTLTPASQREIVVSSSLTGAHCS